MSRPLLTFAGLVTRILSLKVVSVHGDEVPDECKALEQHDMCGWCREDWARERRWKCGVWRGRAKGVECAGEKTPHHLQKMDMKSTGLF